jgi:cytochrome c peroxidase
MFARAMSAARAGLLLALGVTSLSACAGQGSTLAARGSGAHPDASANDDPDPVLTTDELAALSAIALDEIPAPPSDVSNRFADDARAQAFGQTLFFDPSFSGRLLDGDNDGSVNALGRKGDTGKVACAGCHLPDSGFSDTRSLGGQISLAAGWGHRRAPSLLDVSRSKLIMWDGRRDALYNQVFGPIESAFEMNSSRLYAAKQVFSRHRTEYEALFGPMPPLDDTSRFPDLAPTVTGCAELGPGNVCTSVQRGAPGDGAEYDHMTADDQTAVTRVIVNVGKAIGAYERLLTCGTSAFDRWARGDTSALGRAEQRGAALFAGKARCITCHSGPFLSDEKFHDVGLKPTIVAVVFIDSNDQGAADGLRALIADPLNTKGPFSDGDDGRTPASVPPEATGAFRTPRLRCASKRPAFMHTGQLKTLDDVVAFFSRGGDSVGYPGTKEITPLDLTLRERADLVAFLKSLDGPGPDAKLLAPPQ